MKRILYEREAGKKIVTQREMILFYEADHTLNHFEFHRIAIGWKSDIRS